MPTKPTSSTWTIRFKHHRTTILLHIDPQQTFSTIRADLLKAISDTNPNGTFNNQTIPRNPDNVLLARPIDPNDLTYGWELLQRSDGDDDSGLSGKGKGKGKAGVSATGGKARKENRFEDCPQGAGLKDGSVVAFKFKSTEDAGWQAVDGEGEDEDIAIPTEEWDVVVPSMEETYGDQDAMEQDVGDEGAVV